MTDPADDDILRAYLARTPRSAALATRAGEALAGGVVTDTRVFRPYGIYVDRAEGVRKWDVDGNAYLDLFGGHGANMLGHAHPVMVEAVRSAVGRGVQYAANHPLEVALAERVRGLVPTAERVRFTGSGTEATLLALRLARAATGRTRIVRILAHYHGWHDGVASGYLDGFDGSAAAGVLPAVAEQTTLLRPEDMAGLDRLVARHGDGIAAFIAEPVGTHFGVVPVSPAFLHAIQARARGCGALFVLDEVLSGFRVAMGGAQSVLGLKPDLTTLAKVLCGGMPGGAVAGSAEVMGHLESDPDRRGGRRRVLHQGTFTANPVSMASGLAVLDELERIDGCRRASALGAEARRRLNDLSRDLDLPFAWYGEFSIFHLHVRRDGGSGDRDFAASALSVESLLDTPQPVANRLRMALNVLGVDVNTRCSGLFSAVHGEADIGTLAEAMAEAARMLRRAGLV